jgi:hypothetical protein
MAGTTIKIKPGDPPVTTTTPQVTVDTTGLPVGKYTFQLTVEDSTGVKSPPTSVVVTIVAQPVAVLTGPASVNVNTAINLDGSTSTDPGGTIGKYYWSVVTTPTLLGPPILPPITPATPAVTPVTPIVSR